MQAAHLAVGVDAADRPHQRRLGGVGAEAVAARDAAEEREQVADARHCKGEALWSFAVGVNGLGG